MEFLPLSVEQAWALNSDALTDLCCAMLDNDRLRPSDIDPPAYFRDKITVMQFGVICELAPPTGDDDYVRSSRLAYRDSTNGKIFVYGDTILEFSLWDETQVRTAPRLAVGDRVKSRHTGEYGVVRAVMKRGLMDDTLDVRWDRTEYYLASQLEPK